MHGLEGHSDLLILSISTSAVTQAYRDSLTHPTELYEPHCLWVLNGPRLEIICDNPCTNENFLLILILSPVLISDLETCFFLRNHLSKVIL